MFWSIVFCYIILGYSATSSCVTSLNHLPSYYMMLYHNERKLCYTVMYYDVWYCNVPSVSFYIFWLFLRLLPIWSQDSGLHGPQVAALTPIDVRDASDERSLGDFGVPDEGFRDFGDFGDCRVWGTSLHFTSSPADHMKKKVDLLGRRDIGEAGTMTRERMRRCLQPQISVQARSAVFVLPSRRSWAFPVFPFLPPPAVGLRDAFW